MVKKQTLSRTFNAASKHRHSFKNADKTMQRPLLWESFDVYFRRTYMKLSTEETQMNVDKDNRQTYDDKVSKSSTISIELIHMKEN